MFQSTDAFGRISYPEFARVVRTWQNGALFLHDFVSGSLSSVSGCCMWTTEHWIFLGDDFVRGAMLGSTVDLGSATVLGFWTNFTHFLRRRGLGFGRFFSMGERARRYAGLLTALLALGGLDPEK